MTQVEVGMKLYREIFHRNSPTEIKEYTVSKIGKKYFYLLENDRYNIRIDNFRYEDKDYSQGNFQLYRTKEEIELRHEKNMMFSKLQRHFALEGQGKGNTIEQLREVVKILEL